MTRRLKIRVDHACCVGNAMCLATAPAVFAHNDQRQSEVVDAGGDSEEKILEAAFNCPTGAIRVETAEGGELLFPKPEGADGERVESG